MTSLDSLKKRLDSVLQVQQQRQTHDHEELEVKMAELARRRLEFSKRAPELFETVIEPRLRLFAEQLPDSLYTRTTHGHSGIVSINRHRRYAAMVELEVSVTCDGQVEQILVPYELRIIPILIQFEREDTLSLPLFEADAAAVRAFVDSKLEGAARSYVELTNNPHYQREHLVIDPVCGMTIHEDQAAAVVEHEGRKIFFCAQVCKERFEQDPSEFVLT